MHSANFTHILWDNKSPFFFSRNTHDYAPILHCNHHSMQHNQDALPASTLSLSVPLLLSWTKQCLLHLTVVLERLISWRISGTALKLRINHPLKKCLLPKLEIWSTGGPEWRNTAKLTGEGSERTAKRKIKLESNQSSREYGYKFPFVLDK